MRDTLLLDVNGRILVVWCIYILCRERGGADVDEMKNIFVWMLMFCMHVILSVICVLMRGECLDVFGVIVPAHWGHFSCL